MIWGRQDRVLPLADGEAAVQKMANVRLQIMDQAGHCPQIDKPEEFNAAVLDFLNTVHAFTHHACLLRSSSLISRLNSLPTLDFGSISLNSMYWGIL